MKRILILDDELFVLEVLQRILQRIGYQVDVADSREKAFQLFSHTSYDLMLIDIVMPGVSGFEVARQIREMKPSQKIVMTTGLGAETVYEEATMKNVDVDSFLFKPFTFDRVQVVLDRVLDTSEAISLAGTG